MCRQKIYGFPYVQVYSYVCINPMFSNYYVFLSYDPAS